MKSGPEKLSAFVFSVARHVRARRWRAKRTRSLLETEAREIPDTKPTALSRLETRDEIEMVLLAINTLEPVVRDVFHLRFVEEYSVKEVADSLDLPVGTVKSHIHRGR